MHLMLIVPLWFIISSGHNCVLPATSMGVVTGIENAACAISGPYTSKEECEKNNLSGIDKLYFGKDNKVYDKEDTLGDCKQLNKAVMYDSEYSKYCDKCDKENQ